MIGCYERSLNGNWHLVVYHDNIFNNQLNKITRSNTFVVPDSMIDIDGSPRLGLIRVNFPEPKKENEV